MTICANCKGRILENYCPICGQPAKLKRIDGHYVLHEIEHILHFERGILFTLKELLLRPGFVIKQFITENRNRLVKPVIFLIVTSLIYNLVANFFHADASFIKISNKPGDYLSKIMAWTAGNIGYTNLILSLFIAFWIRIFFKKYNYNFFEILILLCFVVGMLMLIFTVSRTLLEIPYISKFQFIAGPLGLAYYIWAISQFFDRKKWISYLKVIASSILGFLSFVIVISSVGIFLDFLFKH